MLLNIFESKNDVIEQALDICKTLSVSYNEMKDRTGIVHRAQSMKLDYNKDMAEMEKRLASHGCNS